MRGTLFVVFFAVGCGSANKEPEVPRSPPSTEPHEETKPDTGDTKPGEVNTKETAIPRCGPADSYHYVVNVFVCKDGTNPFKGNLAAGHDARIGNVGASSKGH